MTILVVILLVLLVLIGGVAAWWYWPLSQDAERIRRLLVLRDWRLSAKSNGGIWTDIDDREVRFYCVRWPDFAQKELFGEVDGVMCVPSSLTFREDRRLLREMLRIQRRLEVAHERFLAGFQAQRDAERSELLKSLT